MVRRNLGKGLGMGYKNLVPLDSHIHSLSAKGVKTEIKLKTPKVKLLTPKQFDKKFQSDYEDYEVGYGTTKIYPDGSVNIFIKHEPEDFERSGKLLHHELAELDIWEDLVEKGMDLDYAEEVAHNKNPVKIEGVENLYALDSANSLNARSLYAKGKRGN